MAVTPNYVKFTRGTPTAYANLRTKDPDTLYFISEKSAETGILYLGEKVIAGGNSSVSVTSLSDLTDVLLSNSITDSSLLVYDDASDKWINKTIVEVFESIIGPMKGATATTPGLAGLVPVPQAGDQDKVLLGDGTWSNGLKDLTAVVTQLLGDDIDLSIREIAEDVFDTYVGGAEDLKEIIEWFEKNPDFTDFNTRLVSVEKTIFDQGSEEEGNFVPGLQTTVGTLQISMKDLSDNIIDIYERLTWQEMDDDDTTGGTE